MFSTQGGLEFTVTGIPVRVLPTFFLFVVIMGLGFPMERLVIWIVVVFVSILLHELGHAVAYRAFGVQPSVVIHGFGGLTFGRSLSTGRDLVVSLAGPAAGFALGVPVLLLADSLAPPTADPLLRFVVSMIAFVNIFWGVINLLPVLPLDGGHATVALTSLLLRRDTTRGVRVVSIIVAILVALVALERGAVFLTVLFGLFAFTNARELRAPGPWTGGAPVSLKANVKVVMPPKPGRRDKARPDEPTPDATGSPWTPRPAPGVRTFAQERASAVRALLGDTPELSLVAADRMRKLATGDADLVASDEIEAFAWLRMGRMADAAAVLDRLPEEKQRASDGRRLRDLVDPGEVAREVAARWAGG